MEDLSDKVADNTPIVNAHSRSVSVEDTGNSDLKEGRDLEEKGRNKEEPTERRKRLQKRRHGV